MEWDYFLQTIVLSAASASVVLIAAIGLAVVFGLMGVINLAHGEFIMFGAYATLLSYRTGLPFPAAVLIGTLATALFGIVVERLIVCRLYGRLLDTMLATWGLSLVLYQSAVLMFGTVTPGIGLPMSHFEIGRFNVSSYLVFLIGVAIALFVLLYVVFTRTAYGVMARAAIQDPTTSRAVGIETSRLNMATFGIGAGLAGFAGGILLPLIPASPSMGFGLVIKAFLTVVAAGPVTLSGAFLSGGLLGTISGVTSSFWSTVAGNMLFFLATIVILCAFPKGISERWRLKL